MKRKAYKLIPKPGAVKNLKLIEEDFPEPSPGEVTIEVKAIGLNFADIACILGLYKAAPAGSFIPGLEYAGTIIKVGQGVAGYFEGDKIMGITRFGGYTSHINIPHQYITRLPAGWSFEEGAAYLVQSLTAYYALVRLAAIEENQTILIQSAAGGVGILANRIAKKYNAYTIGTIGNPSKADLLKKEGYDAVIVRSENYMEDLKNALKGRSLNIVLDSIGGKILKDSFRMLAPEGRLVVFGSASFMTPGNRPDYLKMLIQYWKRPMIDPMRLTQWNKAIMGFNLIYLYERSENIRKYLTHLEQLNIGKPHVGQIFHFSSLLEGVRLLQSGSSVGKVVITMGQI
jgi:NADPH:quinone reductase-like Zn-dependent oxidoreductase